ncbi:MAG: tripartite tricarboxylate transporter TctB family protein [Deltaproteobacteria bacterium]|nr:tripartite tricarboxylate transporter TctB family protein [Deltaproteobacteria bacterium]
MNGENNRRINPRADLLFCLFLLALVIVFFVAAMGYRPVTRYAPMVVLVPLVFMLLLQLAIILREFKGYEIQGLFRSFFRFLDPVDLKKGGQLFLWMVALMVLISFFGQLLGIALFLVSFLRFASKERWWLSFAIGICITLGLHVLFEIVLRIMLYPGALFKYLSGLVGT